MPKPTASPARTRRRWPRITAWTVGGILLVLIVGGVVFAFQARSVWSDLTAAKSDLSSVLKDVKKGDTARVDATAQHAHEKAAHANDTVGNPLWTVASVIPFAGPNVDAVRRATQATYDLVDGALPRA
ncbi:hypothetical protein [Microbacterium elymi]|uniref:Uncharacterized protein n=1 Tax=Microbacterium elymi TaxID=2909587 RepID=A0ABY5NKK4_9MICO|nr:hypothetical protein [Microbacterium elymi]UUT35713.1 hypothetical protein L2X98_21040 [Microbacterium elymi]